MPRSLNLSRWKSSDTETDQKRMRSAVFALAGTFLPLLHRQKGQEPSCGLQPKLANKKMVEAGKQQ